MFTVYLSLLIEMQISRLSGGIKLEGGDDEGVVARAPLPSLPTHSVGWAVAVFRQFTALHRLARG